MASLLLATTINYTIRQKQNGVIFAQCNTTKKFIKTIVALTELQAELDQAKFAKLESNKTKNKPFSVIKSISKIFTYNIKHKIDLTVLVSLVLMFLTSLSVGLGQYTECSLFLLTLALLIAFSAFMYAEFLIE